MQFVGGVELCCVALTRGSFVVLTLFVGDAAHCWLACLDRSADSLLSRLPPLSLAPLWSLSIARSLAPLCASLDCWRRPPSPALPLAMSDHAAHGPFQAAIAAAKKVEDLPKRSQTATTNEREHKPARRRPVDSGSGAESQRQTDDQQHSPIHRSLRSSSMWLRLSICMHLQVASTPRSP